MAVYRIFPEKDTFIFSEYPTGNAGKDEILEVGGYPNESNIGHTSRILLKFPTNEINDVINNKIGDTNFSSSIHLYLADASELPTNLTLYSYPLYTNSGDWDNGVGKYGDLPVNKTGVSWQYERANETSAWLTSGFLPSITASFTSSLPGGGTWYTTANGESMEFSKDFNLNSNLDLDINITPAIKQIYNSTLPNNGFIIKLQDSLEFNSNNSIKLKYFGGDTNTIYPPFLEIAWDDSSYNTGSLQTLSTDLATIDIQNNKGKYAGNGKQRFRIIAKPQYPARTFTTSSVYLTNYALPTASYWGIRDENTEEMVIDFNTEFTKISCDPEGPYFDIYMDGLQPERYYRILVKTELDTSTVVRDNQNIFKVVRNG